MKRENIQSGPVVKKAFYATNDVPPCHISIDLTIHSCTHKYNSIKHKILKHLSNLRSSNASHLLVPPNLHPTVGAATHRSRASVAALDSHQGITNLMEFWVRLPSHSLPFFLRHGFVILSSKESL